MDEPVSNEPTVEDRGDTAPPVEGRPRVFVWGDGEPQRGLLRKFVDRLRGDEHRPTSRRPRDATPPTVFRPPVTRRTAPELEASPRPIRPTPRGGWDPPDLNLDIDETESGSEGVQPDAPSPEPPAPEGDHGPGPLSRATLQLLPGRLRPLDPDVVREEIRFVRPSGSDAVVTLGWADDEPPDHITLNHPSVQDRHARMSYRDRRWHIESLVRGHPVQVNAVEVPVGAEPRELTSGDEVRLGDARFSFLIP